MKKGIIAGLFILLAGTVFASAISRDYYSSEDITAIKADLKFENIIIDSSKDDDIRIEISCNNARKIPELSMDDGILLIRNVKKGTYAENCSIYIYLPEDYDTDYIEIKTLSGDIDIMNVKTQDLILSVASGDIRCINVEVENNIVAKAMSGDITFKSAIADEMKMNAASGDINLKKITASVLEANTASGDIEAESITIDEVECGSASGEIELEKVTCESFDLSSASGSILVKLNKEPKKESSISTKSGSVDVRIPKNAPFEMDVSSTSGSFDDDFSGKKFRPRSVIKSKYNGGGVKINVKTVSGSVSLDD